MRASGNTFLVFLGPVLVASSGACVAERNAAPATMDEAGSDAGADARLLPKTVDAVAADTGAGDLAGPGDQGRDAGASNASPADADPSDMGPVSSDGGGVCPAPPPAADQVVIYGDAVLAGWTTFIFNASSVAGTKTVCTGTRAAEYVMTGAFQAFVFAAAKVPVAASHLSASIHLDAPGSWSVAAVRPGQSDPHQFIGGPRHFWKAGWQRVELDIPATTPTTERIIFEKQGPGPARITLDDLRLTSR